MRLIHAGFLAALCVAVAAAQTPRAALMEPSVSPDGAQIFFTSEGGIWSAPIAGGAAHLLWAGPGDPQRPLLAPDGRALAFTADPDGHVNLYVLDLTSGVTRQLTFDDAPKQLDAWSRDGRWLYFDTSGHDISWMNDVYRVSAQGGTPMPVAADRYMNEFDAAPAPDGETLAIATRGISSSQWWRHGHAHLDETELWTVRIGEPPAYQRLTRETGKQLWPMWSADGRTLYYMSDENGAENIWMLPLGGTARPLTHFRDGRLLWPAIDARGRTIVFQRDLGVWKLDTRSGRAAAVAITLEGGLPDPPDQYREQSDRFTDLALSPDGQKAAFVAHGRVFAVGTKQGGEAIAVTAGPERASQLAWAPDSRRLAYVAEAGGTRHLFLYDFDRAQSRQLTQAAANDSDPTFSPDGRWLAFLRGRRQVLALNLASGEEKPLASALVNGGAFFGGGRILAWSPDSQWLAYLGYDQQMFSNAYVVPLNGGAAKPVTFLANSIGGSLAWTPDGKQILLTTGQRTEPFEVARVDLVPATPKFREDEFFDLFKAPSAAPARGGAGAARAEGANTAPSVAIDFNGIERRLRLLPIGLNVNSLALSRDGKQLVLIATSAGRANLYSYSLDPLAAEPPVAKQLTATSGMKAGAQFAPDGKQVFYLDGGRIFHVALAKPEQPEPLHATAAVAVRFGRDTQTSFDEAWRALRDDFVDAHMNGTDWPALRARFAPYVAAARTDGEFRRLVSLMIGELNSSHMGIAPPRGAARPVTGRLGLFFDRQQYEQTGQLRVTAIVPLGPADVAGVRNGEILQAVNGYRLQPRDNLDALLAHQIGRKVTLTLAENGAERQVTVEPADDSTIKHLIYLDWAEQNRELVDRLSGGRLGYVHIPDMSAESLAQLYVDLDAKTHAKQGVIVDIRDNTGGFVNAYALDVFARRGYLTMIRRGFPAARARSVLGQRALELPTVLMTSQQSLSDAEDFTEGYRALHLGEVVGQPTGGWIIYTGAVTLLNGDSLRMPGIRVLDADGKPMELHPRPVDVAVQRPLGESYHGQDVQLATAVKVLLAGVVAKARPAPPAPRRRQQP